MTEAVTTANGRILITDALRWLAAKANLAKAKQEESKLRKEICAKLLEGGPRRGRVVFEDDEFKIVAHAKVNVNCDEAILNALWESGLLTDEDASCFSKRLQVSDTIHKRPADSNVWKAITTKEATPGLEIERKEHDGD